MRNAPVFQVPARCAVVKLACRWLRWLSWLNKSLHARGLNCNSRESYLSALSCSRRGSTLLPYMENIIHALDQLWTGRHSFPTARSSQMYMWLQR